jgi:hypothetical protein
MQKPGIGGAASGGSGLLALGRHNPIASAMIERAAAFTAGDRDAVENLAATFEALSCPYQQERTGVIASMIT